MAIRIKFDKSHNAIEPTLVLATRSGKKIGRIPAYNIIVKDCLNTYSEISFKVNKEDCKDNLEFWDQLIDFKLIWVREWNKWLELYVEIDESTDIVKVMSARSLGEAELSQINLYGIEINTDEDIAREDYEPTVLFNGNRPNASLLTRISEKIPHYTIKHVDSSIARIQRTFQFDGITIYDAFQEIAEEINCIFIINCYSDDEHDIVREISVYDLEANCLECGERGEFSVCPNCGSTDLTFGYGEDTKIYVSTDNLANSISYATDNGSVKNCFKLEAGDDLMTATIVNCNPNGSPYIWYISNLVKSDMSKELVEKLEQYDQLYADYQNNYQANVSGALLNAYNALVRKYNTYSHPISEIPSPIVGYSALMEAYYSTIDFNLYLSESMMPSFEMTEITAQTEVAKLSSSNLSPIAVRNLETCSSATADSAVLGMARTLVNGRYQVKLQNTSYIGSVWTGYFVVTSYMDEEDTATSNKVTVSISGDYQKYLEQRIEKALRQSTDEDNITDIVQLFGLGESNFRNELKKYCLQRLVSFRSSCQSCLDVLTEQGVANNKLWEDENNKEKVNYYQSLYLPYYNKLGYIEEEIKVRQDEVDTIVGVYDSDGGLVKEGFQNVLDQQRDAIHDALDFQEFLGEELWLEFAAYRREDTYRNDNYISDGLNNAELFERAREFVQIASDEIYKSATLQHSISASLKDLLTMKEFAPIVDYFEVGNWIRIRVDGSLYRLRILDYEINYDDLTKIDITFSDVTYISGGISDINSVLDQASGMASSYDSTKRQAEKGKWSRDMLDGWVERGLDATNVKIISNADNQNQTWDSHGMLFRKYDDVSDTYDDEQLKILNSTIAITNDNWKTIKTAVGGFYYYDPVTGKLTYAYGINAETLIGKLILGEELGIYNSANSMTFDRNGLVITNGINSFKVNPNSKNLLVLSNEKGDILWVDDKGGLHIVGDGAGLDITTNQTIVNMNGDIEDMGTRFTVDINGLKSEVYDITKDEKGGLIHDMRSEFTQTAKDITAKVEDITMDADGHPIHDLKSQITQTASNIRSEVSDAIDGVNSSIDQTKDAITAEVKRAEGAESTIKQTADKIEWVVASGTNESDFTMTDRAIKLSTKDLTLSVKSETDGNVSIQLNDKDGIKITSGNVTIKGVVTFTGLQNGTTTIDGSCIKTGTIDADRLNLTSSIQFADLDFFVQQAISNATADAQSATQSFNRWVYPGSTYIDGGKIMTGTVQASVLKGGVVSLLASDASEVGTITIGEMTTGSYGLVFASGKGLYSRYGGIRLDAGNGNFWVDSTNGNFGTSYNTYAGVSQFQIGVHCVPTQRNTNLGLSSNMWGVIYASTGEINTSDKNLKFDIEALPDKYLDMLDLVEPVRYKLNDGQSGRFHTGFISQQVEEAMNGTGIDSLEFGGFVKDIDGEGNDIYMLRYEEFIAINTKMIQILKKEVAELKETISQMKGEKIDEAGNSEAS